MQSVTKSPAPRLRRIGADPIRVSASAAQHDCSDKTPPLVVPVGLFTHVAGESLPFEDEVPSDHLFAEMDRGPGGTSSDEDAVQIAERRLIGAILCDNSLFDVVTEIVRPDMFGDIAARTSLGHIESILTGGVDGVRVADPLTVAMLAGADSAVTGQILNEWSSWPVPPQDLLESYASAVRDQGRVRKLQQSISVANSIASDHTLSVDERASRVEREMTAAEVHKLRKAKGVGDHAVAAIDALIERASRGVARIGAPTGLDELDAILSGLQGGKLYIVAGRPSMGKSALALGMGLAAAEEGTPAALYSFEMDGAENSQRALAFISDVDAGKLRDGALNEAEWMLVMDAAEKLRAIPLLIDDNPSGNIAELCSSARRLHREGKLDLLIVDYIQIMIGNSKVNREQQVAEISRGLKLLAKELDIPVIALSQLNRSLEARVDKRPMMSDLRESGSLEQDADVIMFVYRDDVYNPSSPDAGLAEIIVAKQRAGRKGTVKSRFSTKTAQFENLHKKQQVTNQGNRRPSPSSVYASADPLADDFLPPMVR